jgi:hypothetical protein
MRGGRHQRGSDVYVHGRRPSGGQHALPDRLDEPDPGCLDLPPLPVQSRGLEGEEHDRPGKEERGRYTSSGRLILPLSERGRAEEEERGKGRQHVPGIRTEHEVLDEEGEEKKRAGEAGSGLRASKWSAEKESGRSEDEKRRGDPGERDCPLIAGDQRAS